MSTNGDAAPEPEIVTPERDPHLARQVEAMAGYGIAAKDIALVVGIDPDVLRRDYRQELEGGVIKANAKVAESLFRKATSEGPQSVAAAIFWLKTQAGWRETSVHELTGRGGRAIELNAMSNEEIEARIHQLARTLKIDLGLPPLVPPDPDQDE